MKKHLLAKIALGGLALSIALGTQTFAADSSLKTDQEKLGYAFGMNIADALKQRHVAIDPDFLGKAAASALSGAPMLLTTAELRAVFMDLQSGQTNPPPGDKNFKDARERFGYAIGMNFGQSMKENDVELDVPMLVKGFKDTDAGGATLLTKEEGHAVLTALQEKQVALQKEKAEKNLKDGQDFLAKNKTAEGVVTLPDGLQYKILTPGNGPKPAATSMVTVNYRGTFTDGKEFDASKPGTPPFGVNQVIKGWTEALQLMPTGSKWKLFIPSDLAYGPQGRPGIPGNSVLVFDVELVSFK